MSEESVAIKELQNEVARCREELEDLRAASAVQADDILTLARALGISMRDRAEAAGLAISGVGHYLQTMAADQDAQLLVGEIVTRREVAGRREPPTSSASGDGERPTGRTQP